MVENNPPDIQKEKNSNLSLVLIFVNVLLAFIYTNSTPIRGGQKEISIAVVVWVSTILIGAYAFSYHGKAYRTAKWIFAILLLVSIFFIFIYIYVAGLARAFQH